MKIRYYGTGDGYGIPEPFCSCRLCAYARAHGGKDFRTRSQAVIDDLMIDCSTDLLAHTLFYGLDMNDYHHILITHGHGDHYAMGDLNSRYQSDSEWHLYLPPALMKRETARRDAVMSRNTKTPPQRFPVLHEVIPFQPFEIAGYTVTALPSNHMPEGEAVLYIVSHEGKNVLWLHDSGDLLPETKDYLRGLSVHFDFVSMDCTLARDSHFTPSHMDIMQCAGTASWLRETGRADEHTVFMLSHIGHLIDRTHDELCTEAAEFGFRVAYDTMEIIL